MKDIKTSPLETRPLIWKTDVIPNYFIRNDGVLFHNNKQCSSWQINNRNYSLVCINNHSWTYRIDYMVAYTFLGYKEDAVRLIHLNGNLQDDSIDNLIWYRKIDIKESYKDLVIFETNGSIQEEWRKCITEYNMDLGYEVSNLGFIRDKNHNMIPIYESHGYRVFYYLDSSPKKQTRIKSIHRAVAQAFIPNPNNYELINHIDGNKFNDIIFNLEWSSSSMNMEHAYLQNLNNRSSYTKTQIETVCELLIRKIPHVQISFMTGVDRKTISDIYRGRRWKEISSKYIMPEHKWSLELKDKIASMIISGKKSKEIFTELNIEYNQSAISLYERIRRELKADNKIS